MQKEIYWLKNNKIFRFLKVTGILIIPVILFFLPLQAVENNHSICIYKNLTGFECWGCGMTRAILSAIHFQFDKAFVYNRLVIIVLPLLFYIWLKTLKNLWYGAAEMNKN